MRPKIIIWFLMLSIFSAWIVSANGMPQSPSAIIFDQDYGFSSVLEGDPVVHEFKIQNQGTIDLIIEGVETD